MFAWLISGTRNDPCAGFPRDFLRDNCPAKPATVFNSSRRHWFSRDQTAAITWSKRKLAPRVVVFEGPPSSAIRKVDLPEPAGDIATTKARRKRTKIAFLQNSNLKKGLRDAAAPQGSFIKTTPVTATFTTEHCYAHRRSSDPFPCYMPDFFRRIRPKTA
jgi:hypothetical protein